MLHKLENSGLPIYRDDETGKLALEAPLTYKGFAEKTLSQMKDCLLMTVEMIRMRIFMMSIGELWTLRTKSCFKRMTTNMILLL